MKVIVYFVNGKSRTFEKVRAFKNQEDDYYMAFSNNDNSAIFPKTSVLYAEVLV